MKNKIEDSPRPLLSKDQAGTANIGSAFEDKGFFGSLALREAAHRPTNEAAIRGMA